MARVDWTATALRDVARIRRYIEQFDPIAAQRISAALIAAGDGLAHFPNRGRQGTRGRRELPSVPPYVIRYLVDGDVVTIVDVRHGARRPS